LAGLGFALLSGPAEAQYYDPCPTRWLNDGDCDEPNGLGNCAYGTDTADCSNPGANYGGGSGYGTGPMPTPPPGGDTATPGGGYLLNPCPHLNDGDCDEPEGLGLCAEGTDVVDCSDPKSNYGAGSGYAGPPGAGNVQPPAAGPDLTGTWTLTSSHPDYAGTISFYRSPGVQQGSAALTGLPTYWYDGEVNTGCCTGRFFQGVHHPTTGLVYFRPIGRGLHRMEGTLQGNVISGTFSLLTTTGRIQVTWTATR